MSELKIGKIEFGPLQCSQGGVPYNKEHLEAKDKRIAELEEQIQLEQQYSEDLVQTGAELEVDNERLRADVKELEEQLDALADNYGDKALREDD